MSVECYSVSNSVKLNVLLAGNLMSADSVKIITEIDKKDPSSAGELTQNEINLAAVRIKKSSPNDFDAFLVMLAEQSASVTLPIELLNQCTEVDMPESQAPNKITEEELPSFSIRINDYTGVTDEYAYAVDIESRPKTDARIHGGGLFSNPTYAEAPAYILIVYGRIGTYEYDKNYYVSGTGIRQGVPFQVEGSNHFDKNEARQMIKYIDSAIGLAQNDQSFCNPPYLGRVKCIRVEDGVKGDIVKNLKILKAYLTQRINENE